MFSTTAMAQMVPTPEEKPDDPLVTLDYDNLLAIRVNPLGLQNYFNLFMKARLFRSDNPVLQGAHFSVGPTVVASPAFAKVGAFMQFAPVAMLELRGTYRYQYFFGTFDQIIPEDSPYADWSDSARRDKGDEAMSMGGHQVALQARVQAKVSAFAIRNTTRFVYNDMPLPDGAVAYYDQTPDILVPNKGWIGVNDLDMFGLYKAFKFGGRYTWTASFFGGDDGHADNVIHRLGPMITWTFFDKPGSSWNQPTLVLLSQWHIRHPNRAGQDVSQAIPYLALAFTFKGTLIPSHKKKKQ